MRLALTLLACSCHVLAAGVRRLHARRATALQRMRRDAETLDETFAKIKASEAFAHSPYKAAVARDPAEAEKFLLFGTPCTQQAVRGLNAKSRKVEEGFSPECPWK